MFNLLSLLERSSVLKPLHTSRISPVILFISLSRTGQSMPTTQGLHKLVKEKSITIVWQMWHASYANYHIQQSIKFFDHTMAQFNAFSNVIEHLNPSLPSGNQIVIRGRRHFHTPTYLIQLAGTTTKDHGNCMNLWVTNDISCNKLITISMATISITKILWI